MMHCQNGTLCRCEGRNPHWFIVNKTTFPWEYYGGRLRDGGFSFTTFYGSALAYTTHSNAQSALLLLVSQYPPLIGKLDVHRRGNGV